MIRGMVINSQSPPVIISYSFHIILTKQGADLVEKFQILKHVALMNFGSSTAVNVTPQLYLVAGGTYASNWSHGLEATSTLSIFPNEIFGLSSITVATNTPYFGNTYCSWKTENKSCSLSMQIDVNTSVGSLIYEHYFNAEFRIGCTSTISPTTFPIPVSQPILPCKISIINNGRDIINYSTYSGVSLYQFYVQLLLDGTMAILYDQTDLGKTPPLLTSLAPLNLEVLSTILDLSFWNVGTSTVGISICVEGSFLLA